MKKYTRQCLQIVENTLVPSVREIKNGDRQANKKSDTTLVSSTLTSFVLAWALSLRYGNEAEILKFLLVPNLP